MGLISYTANATDSYGRTSSDTVSVDLHTNVAFVYDLNGNLITNGTQILDYDDENQLTSVTVSNAWRSEFVYDGKMRRRVRREYTWSAGDWVMTNLVEYVYDGNVVIQERWFNPALTGAMSEALNNATNIPENVVTYTRGLDLSGNSSVAGSPRERSFSLTGAGGIGGLLARTEGGGPGYTLTGVDTFLPGPIVIPGSAATAYYHCDGNGNITCMVNTNNQIAAQYLYDPFGNLISKSGWLADANLYRFSSKEAHLNSGLVYYLYRYYASTLQRWVNRDPLGEIGFETRRFPIAEIPHLAQSLERLDASPLYDFIGNQPSLGYDAEGLVAGTPTGPDSLACIAAQEQAIAALQLEAAEPCAENKAKADAAVMAAVAACTPPDPPPTPPWCPPNRWVPPYIPPPNPQQAAKVIGTGLLITIVVIIFIPVGA